MLTARGTNDPRVRRTKQRLQDAFIDLARIKDFDTLTVKDITDRADVNRATFYAHFDDKYALLGESIRTTFMQIVQRRLPTGIVTTAADLEPTILALCEFFRHFDGKCWQQQRRFGVLVEQEIKALLTDMLHAWLAQAGTQAVRDSANAELTATMASWAIYGAALHWSQKNPRQAEEDFARSVLALIAGNVMLVER
jgi:AcrR family transcriptional regulator